MPTYLLTSPEGKKYRVTGQGSSGEAMAHLQSMLGVLSPKESAMNDYKASVKKANEDASVLDTIRRSVPLGLKKAAAGGLELVGNTMEALGLPVDQERMQDLAAVQREYETRGTGTGITGAIAELASDPTNYIPAGKLAKVATIAAAQGFMAPTGNENSGLADNAENAMYGAAAGVGGDLIGKGISRIAKPVRSEISDNAKKLSNTLESNGIKLTAAQKTGSTPLATLESVFEKLPFTSASQRKIFQDQQAAFTQAALGKAGITAPDASRKVIDDAGKKFGKEYEDLAARNLMQVDEPLLQQVFEVWQKANTGRLGGDDALLVNSIANDLFNAGGAINGAVYHETRKMLGQKAQGLKISDPFASDTMRGLRNALDSAFERGLNVSDRGKLADINARYQPYKAIKKARESSNAGSVRDAMLNPTALYNADAIGTNLSDLSDAGAAYLRPQIPDSGTAQRASMQAVLQGSVAAGGAGLAGYGASSDNDLLTGVGLALAGPKIAQKAYNSKAGQKYLTEGMNKYVQKAANATGKVLPKVAVGALKQSMIRENQQPKGNVEVDSTVPLDSMLRGPHVNLPQVRGHNAGAMMLSGTAMDNASRAELPSPTSEYLRKLAAIESSGNNEAKNSNSSASGRGQFIDSTWNYMVSKYGKDYGLTRKGRNNPEQADIASALYAQENSNALAKKLGREPEPEELYMAHFLGAGGAGKFLTSNPQAKAAQILPRAAKSNQSIFFKNGKPLTVAQVYENISNKWKDA